MLRLLLLAAAGALSQATPNQAEAPLKSTPEVVLPSGQSYRPVVDQRHPDFTLPSVVDGKARSLSDFHGKRLLLIHFASW